MLVEDIALDVYMICRNRSNSTSRCLQLICTDIIKNESSINDQVLEDKIRKYRDTYKDLEELSKYVHEKITQNTWKTLI